MKQYLKISLLIVFISLFGSAFGQFKNVNTPPRNEAQEQFAAEMERLNKYCDSVSFKSSMAKTSDAWYEPEVITFFNVNGNPMNRYSWTYSNEGNVSTRNVLTEKLEAWNGQELINYTRKTFTYDEAGNWVACLLEVWNGEDWVDNHRFACTYDANKNMLFQTQDKFDYEQNKWVGDVRWTNTWSSSNKILSRVFERETDGVWSNSIRQVYSYDGKDSLLTSYLNSWENNQWGANQGWEYSYDENGNKLEAKFTNMGSYVSRETYTYDENNNKLTLLNEKYENGNWKNFWRNTWTYGDNNLPSLQMYDEFIGNEWVVKTRQTWTYREDGMTLTWKCETLKDDVWTFEYELSYTYDENNRIIDIKNNTNDDTSGAPITWHEAFTYDEDGNILTEINEFILENGNILPIVDVAWTYDENGNGTIAEVAIMPDKEATFLSYNNRLSTYQVPYFQVSVVSASYVNINSSIAATSVTLNETNIEIDVIDSFQLTATVAPETATIKEVRWSSSDDKVATVSSDGLVKAVGVGTVVITVTTVDGGLTASCNVTTKAVAVTGVTLNETTLNIPIKEKFNFVATISPTNATNTNVTWSSSDKNIVSIANNGVATAKNIGTAIITVTTADGEFTATCSITVSPVSVDDLETRNIKVFYANNNIVIDNDIEISNVYVYNTKGQLVWKSNNDNPIETSSWSKGIYIINIIDSNNVVSKSKVIIR